MSSGLRLGLITGAVTFLADQALKLWILNAYDLASRGRVEVLPFFDLILVWNRGISYGLLQQDGLIGRLFLLGLSLAACVFIFFWLRKPGTVVHSFGLGLILGGAAGNAVDRAAYGAVADFVLLHAGGFEWYVFNIADAAIVVGVVLILYGALRGEAARS
ncbi:lipoprotein signal peptidase [Terrihabitans soli]|uniref:Lipoprotein signal peptidase n=1 Tax=Terrihabitans soli TaxID=708113 RepID=A0A6S6QK52_9HYPH|nr:signal peptidase II [Terrihabitans soli]BCJ91663.1 lipoprotein signal peptidase [Terrihabitans soli]